MKDDIRCARRNEREAKRRAELDQEYVSRFAERVRELFPIVPLGENRLLPNMLVRDIAGGWGVPREPKAWTRNSLCLQ